jgi:hypothetical protein
MFDGASLHVVLAPQAARREAEAAVQEAARLEAAAARSLREAQVRQ